MRKIKVVILAILLSLFPISIYAYNSITHGALTNQAELSGILNRYLQSVGFPKGAAETTFTLYPLEFTKDYWVPGGEHGRFTQSFRVGLPDLHDAGLDGKINGTEDYGLSATALDWLEVGSVLEDVPMMRAVNHFHDPTNLQGLYKEYLLTDYLTGESARTWAFNDMRMEFMWSAESIEEALK